MLGSVGWSEVVAGALLGAAVQAGVVVAERWLSSRRGEFSGGWWQVVPAWGSDPERWDRVKVAQRGKVISGRIVRVSPPREAGRTWQVHGYVHGNVLAASVYTRTPGKDPSSYGTIVLRREPGARNGSVWRGTYTRPDTEKLAAVIAGRIAHRPLRWQRSDRSATEAPQPGAEPPLTRAEPPDETAAREQL